MAELTLFVNLGIMVIAAALSLFLARALKQPALLGYLIAGVIIGPFGLNLLTHPDEIILLGELGIIFLLFTVGAETDFLKFIKTGPLILIGGVAQIVIAVLLAVFTLPGLPLESALYVGLALSLSSTILVVKILQDKKTLSSLHGQLMLGFLLVEDLVVVIALPLLSTGYANFNLTFFEFLFLKGLFLAGIVAILSKRVFPFIFKISAQSGELLYLTALATCFGFIALAYSLNISLAIGAFLAGLAISNLPYNAEAVSSIRGLRDFFVMLFFVSLGTQLTFTLGDIPLGLAVGAVAIMFVFKPLFLYTATQLAGYGSGTASRVSFGLLNMSEFSLILLFQGHTLGALPEGIYSFLVLLAAVSMVATPYITEYGPRIHAHVQKITRVKVFSLFPLFSRKIEEMQNVPESHLNNHVIILGAGRSGLYLTNHLAPNYPVIVVDHDPNIIAFFRKKKVDAVFGNAHNPEILEKLHAERARLLVIALPDMDETLYILDFAKHHFPKLKVFVKANYYEDAWKFYNHGANYVVLTEIIGGHVFAENVEYFLRKGKPLKPVNMVMLKERVYNEREATHAVKNLL